MVAAVWALGAALVLAAVAGLAGTLTRKHRRQAAELLARSLRRQLMEDNYDYMTSRSAEGGGGGDGEPPQDTTGGRGDKERATTDTAALHGERRNEGKEVEEKVADKLKGSRRSHSSGKSRYTNKDKATRKLSRKLARRRKKFKKYKSLLGKDIAERYRSRYRYRPGNEDTSLADGPGGPSGPGGPGGPATRIHYRVLQMNNGHRRSGRGGRSGALIQEEGPHGVALVKLGGGPFPELRVSTDDPLPLPADPAAPDEHTHTSLDEQENSFKVTVSPDDILVL